MLTAEPLAGLPGVRHGFFTRRGGVSEGLFASLNCGLGSGDDAGNVAENRARAMARLDLPGDALCTAYQHHGARCIPVPLPFAPDRRPRADAMATNRPGVALGILTADCAPVLLADAEAGVVGAAHAGWRGALGGVLEAVVNGMVGLGAARQAITAAVGPCIGQASYEVGPEFRDAFVDADPANARFFVPGHRDDHPHFDLPGYTAARLEGLGLAAVVALDHDTCGDEDRFFSYRRARRRGEADYGHLLSAITLAADAREVNGRSPPGAGRRSASGRARRRER